VTDAAVEAALLRAAREVWHQQNQLRFRGVLRAPTFRLVEGGRLGFWDAARREIALQRSLVRERPWGVVVEVLKHEMAHQYVSEVLGVRDEGPHGPRFRETCARKGIDPRAAGEPVRGPEGEDRVVRRIQKLLALAGSPNRHEAEAAAAAAQSLLLRHNLDVADTAEGTRMEWAHLGRPAARLQQADRMLAAILGRHFFVEVIWVPAYDGATGERGQLIEVVGRAENVAMAGYVHDFLRRTADRLWDELRPRPAGGRRAFLAGVMRGFWDRLEAQAATQRAEGLVWTGDAGAKATLRARHPRVHTVRRQGVARSDAYDHGRDAGRGIVLHRPVEAGPTRVGAGLLTSE